MGQSREEIVAANEAQFRAFNERLRQAEDDGEELEILCECAVAGCRQPLRVGAEEYRGVREDPCLFLVMPGHELPDVESVVDQRGDHLLIRKPSSVSHVVAGASEGVEERFEARLTYVWTSSDEVEFAEAGDVGRRLPVRHDLTMALAREQGHPVSVTIRDGVVVGFSPARS